MIRVLGFKPYRVELGLNLGVTTAKTDHPKNLKSIKFVAKVFSPVRRE
jgi:hypothetical protein